MPALLLLLLLCSLPAFGAEPSPPAGDAIAALEAELEAAEAAPKPDTALLEALRARLAAIRQEQARLAQAEARIQAAQKIEREGNAELSRLLAQARETLPLPKLDGLPAERIDAMLQQAIAEEQAAMQRLEAANQALREVEKRGQALRQTALPPPAEAPPAPLAKNENPLLDRAEALLAQLRQQSLEAEARALALERSTQPLALQLAQARQMQAQHELDQLRKRREYLETALNARRLAEAEATRQSAGLSAENERHPALKSFAEANQVWAERLAELTLRLSELSRQRDEINRRTEAMRQDMLSLRRRLELLGIGPVIGNLLLQKRNELPSEASLMRHIREVRGLVGELQLLDLDIANARAELASPERLLEARLAEASPAERQALEPALRRLIQEREDILQRLDALKPPLLLAINDVEFALESQRRAVREFSDFIAQNLLWMPNARPLWSIAWADYQQSMLALFDPRAAAQDLRAALQGLAAQPLDNLGMAALVLTLLALRPRLRRQFHKFTGDELKPPSEALWASFATIAMIVLYVLPWPLLAWLIGQRLQAVAAPGSFAQGVGHALETLAPLLLYAQAALALFHPKGVAGRLFGWSPQMLQTLRQAMQLFIFGVLPLGFLYAVANVMDAGATRDAAGRLAFMLALFVLALMFARLLHPRGSIMLYWRMTHTRHWSARLAPFWFVLGTGVPLLFAALAALGYVYSASILTQKLVISLWVALGLLVIYDFGLRAIRQARLRLLRQREQAAAQGKGGEGEGPSLAEPAPDVDRISLQSRKLLNFSVFIALVFALYSVWAPIFPALSIFEHIKLWDYRGEIQGESVMLSVSLADALLALFLLFTMWVAARNLPGLMEISLERLTRQDAGTRYALMTVTRYLIVTVGLLLILNRLGLQWSQLQWLVAALGVGLGFGLQEIFANFVSGLIILFERPVRVGDLVTIGENTGFIKRIHIRATVLENYDRMEIVVPNKKLITEQVTNWTLTDPTTRVLADVGVAYGSDPHRVEAVLLEAAKSVPTLLPEPAPLVWFMGFGESALNFRLRAFVGNVDNKLGATSALNYAIEKALREANINIPFPQRDIHIRTIEGLDPRNPMEQSST